MQSLSLLPFLLLATRGLLAAGTPGSWAGRGPGGVQSWWSRPRQPPSLQRGAHPNYDYSGTILTPDDSKCRVSVREQDQGIALKVDCSRLRRRFSCFFVGNPTACTTSVTKKMIYWRQIAQHLRAQVNMCRDAGAALSPRVCGSGFPASALRLVYSTLINATRLDDLDSTPWWHDKKTTARAKTITWKTSTRQPTTARARARTTTARTSTTRTSTTRTSTTQPPKTTTRTTTTQPTTTTRTSTTQPPKTTTRTTTKFDGVDGTDIKLIPQHPDLDIPFLPYPVYEDGLSLPYPAYEDGLSLPYPAYEDGLSLPYPVYEDGPFLPYPVYEDGPFLPYSDTDQQTGLDGAEDAP